ncbi:uncharacterized protein [Parasteatoda tepidariorum]|nr:uncharacterized protein LOC107442796 [Parasteatoda tepidariorum]
MQIIVEPSLQDLILRKIAVFLWNRRNVKSKILDFVKKDIKAADFKYEWRSLEIETKANASSLDLPERTLKKLLFVIKPIGLQIKDWVTSEEGCLFVSKQELDLTEIAWTHLGIVDRQKQVATLMKDKTIDIARRFKLACKFCLNTELRNLWKRMGARKKKDYLYECNGYSKMDMLVRYWTLMTSGRFLVSDMHSFTINQVMFEHVQYSKNVKNMAYFWAKMTLIQRRETFLNFFMNKEVLQNYSDGFCFLLTDSEEELNWEVFEKFPLQTMLCFLCWPLQLYFIESAKHIVPFLSGPHYGIILNNIIKLDGYEEMLREFWLTGSLDQRNYAIDHVLMHSSLMIDLLEFNDQESLLLLVSEATPQQKRKLIFPDELGFILWDVLVYEKRWDALKYLIFICTEDRNVLEEFVTECVELPKCANDMNRMKKFGFLLQTLCLEEEYVNFFHNLIFEYGGYPIEELSDSPPAKKRCS